MTAPGDHTDDPFRAAFGTGRGGAERPPDAEPQPDPGFVVCAELHDDELRIETEFDAASALAGMRDEQISDLAADDWGAYDFGQCSELPWIVGYAADIPEVARVLELARTSECGFSVQFDPDQAHAWLRAHRPQLAARLGI